MGSIAQFMTKLNLFYQGVVSKKHCYLQITKDNDLKFQNKNNPKN
jgi:hypothetical protein